MVDYLRFVIIVALIYFGVGDGRQHHRRYQPHPDRSTTGSVARSQCLTPGHRVSIMFPAKTLKVK